MRDTLSYVCALSTVERRALYEDIWVVHGIFWCVRQAVRLCDLRSLTPPRTRAFSRAFLTSALPTLAKNIVMRIVFLAGEPVTAAMIQAWLKPEGIETLERALDTLLDLDFMHVKREDADGRRVSGTQVLRGGLILSLDAQVGEQLQNALTDAGARPWPSAADLGASVAVPSLSELDEYSHGQWDAVLGFLLGEGPTGGELSAQQEACRDFLLRAGLAAWDEQANGSLVLKLLPAGVKFLLQDVYTQMWIVLRALFACAEELAASEAAAAASGALAPSMTGADVVRFLFLLSFLRVGEAYDGSTLSDEQVMLLEYFVAFGLVYLPHASPSEQDAATWFVPTRMLANLMSGRADSFETDKFILVETNFHVYAYTSSVLRMRQLDLFIHVRGRLPNLVYGIITRKSVQKAFRRGVTAQEVLSFLEAHAHTQMMTGRPPFVPETIVDQIHLWAQENSRFLLQRGFMLRGFYSEAEFRGVRDDAAAAGQLLFASELGARPDALVCIVQAQAEQDALASLARVRTSLASAASFRAS